jgi:hypothetical protein
VQFECKKSAINNCLGGIDQRVQTQCNTIANIMQQRVQQRVQRLKRVQFECNSSATLIKSAIRVQIECNSSAIRVHKRLQCYKRVQNECTNSANKSANIVQYILSLGEFTRERNTCARTLTNSAINNGAWAIDQRVRH